MQPISECLSQGDDTGLNGTLWHDHEKQNKFMISLDAFVGC